MLELLLLILKIIGIVIASVLGLVLFLIVLVLFVPIRYRIKGNNQGEVNVLVKVSWLFRCLYIRAEYANEKFVYAVRIFGYTLMGTNKKKKAKKKTKKKKPKSTNHKKRPDVEPELSIQEIRTQPSKGSKEQTNAKLSIESKDKVTREETNVEATIEELSSKKINKQRVSLYAKIKNFLIKIKQFIRSIPQRIRAILVKLKEIKEMIGEYVRKAKLIYHYVTSQKNRPGFKVVWNAVVDLVKHILPRKLHAEMEIGTGDPCTTGYALGIIGMFYGRFADNIVIRPNFEEQVYVGKVEAIGRIRLFSILWIGLKVIMNKEFKIIKNEFKHLKEEL